MGEYHKTNQELREEILELHDKVAGFLKQTEQLQGEKHGTSALFDINVGNRVQVRPAFLSRR